MYTAEDLAQEASIQVLAYLKERECFGQPELPKPDLERLLYCAANRVIKDHFRSQRPEDELPQTLPDCSPDPLDEVLHAEDITLLGTAIQKLPPKQSVAFRMRYLESWSMGEIASALGCTVEAAYVTLHHARQRIAPIHGTVATRPLRSEARR
jgi:RNA polymerase sigma factor (sigma-70 family)